MLGDGSRLPDLTITFGPASTSVLAKFGQAFGNIPPVLLRDTDSINTPSPVIRPSSTEIPDPSERSARLQLFGEIARGGMGAVLKGRDSDLGRDLAVKVLLDSHREKPEMVRRFIEEAQIAGQLQHPGIVPIYELGAFGDRRPYFAMKLVKGNTLAEILAARKSPSEGLPRFLSIFESICQTMAYAHARGVIHRDLKPSNVMVGSFGEVQVMDWGLAKVLPRGGAIDDATAGKVEVQETIIATARSGSDSDLSQAGSVMGTPSYMAPEQARGEIDNIDERADVFALGSIFCEILTGEPAFTGRNSGEIQRKAARGDTAEVFAKLTRVNLLHDPELIELAKSCLAPEPDDRPRHAGEIADQMSGYHSRVQERLRQSEIERAEEKARAEEATKRAAVERDRMRLTVALAASIVGFMLLGGGGWAYFARQKAARMAATERVVTEALDKATLLRGQAKVAPLGDLSKWSEALATVEQARSSLAAGESTDALQSQVKDLLTTVTKEQANAVRRLDEANRDQRFLEKLERIKLERLEKADKWDPQKTDQQYSQAFRDFGIDVNQLTAQEAADQISKRSVPLDFVAFVDDWALSRLRSARNFFGTLTNDTWKIPLKVAQAVDQDPWRNRLRVLIGIEETKSIAEIANDPINIDSQPARSIVLLAQLLEYHNEDQLAQNVLRRSWNRNQLDFAINLQLGRIPRLLFEIPNPQLKAERLRYATTAVTLQPQNPWARHVLGDAYLF
jgi:serine/threonine-protein kinase